MLKKLLQTEIAQAALDFVYPPLCLGCNEYTEEQYQICPKCSIHLEEFSSPFCLECKHLLPNSGPCPICDKKTCYVFSLAHYSSPVVDMIIQYKFKGITRPAELFAQNIADHFGNALKKITPAILHPIPLHPEREKFRGYNQASIFAKAISNHLEIPYQDNILYRIKKRKVQSKMSLSHRSKNIKDVFYVDEDIYSDNKPSVILVDDVITSGHTIKEAKATLEKDGYNVRAVITIAQAF